MIKYTGWNNATVHEEKVDELILEWGEVFSRYLLCFFSNFNV